MKTVQSKGNRETKLCKACSQALSSAQNVHGGQQLTIDNLQLKTKIGDHAFSKIAMLSVMAILESVSQ